MIEQICAFIHNYFVYGRYSGTFTIADGTLTLDALVPGQYFRICGSRLNDGVYQYPATGLADETFDGVIWEMRPPKAFLDVVSQIEAWQQKYGDAVITPYQSESFGGYSYSLKGGSYASGDTSTDSDWRGIFKGALNQWRKLA